MPTVIRDPNEQSGIPPFLRAIFNEISVNLVAGVKITEPKKAFHATRSIFDYFRPKKFGNVQQPASQFVHAGLNPADAELVAMEARSPMYSASPRTPGKIEGLNIKPIVMEAGDEFLENTKLTPEDVQRLLPHAVRRKAAFDRIQATGRQLKNKEQGYTINRLIDDLTNNETDVNFKNIWVDMDPRVLQRAGYKGVLYRDRGAPAVMFHPHQELKTPWGTPLTKAILGGK